MVEQLALPHLSSPVVTHRRSTGPAAGATDRTTGRHGQPGAESDPVTRSLRVPGSTTAGSTTAGSTTAGSPTAGSPTAGSTTAGPTIAGSTDRVSSERPRSTRPPAGRARAAGGRGPGVVRRRTGGGPPALPIDERTRQLGFRGIEAARRALADATQRLTDAA